MSTLYHFFCCNHNVFLNFRDWSPIGKFLVKQFAEIVHLHKLGNLCYVPQNSIHSDPADRLIVACALAESFRLVTADRNQRATNVVQTIWKSQLLS